MQNDASGSAFQCIVFSECTSSLRVGPGRVVEVIHYFFLTIKSYKHALTASQQVIELHSHIGAT
jgi:hypothetical protein